MSQFGGKPVKCPRCTKTVYMAEEIIAAGKKYHKSCLKCKSCDKSLQLSNLTERNGDIYCKSCYGRQFGPKGYGYGQGAGVLSSEAPVSSNNNNNKTNNNKKSHKPPFCVQCGAGSQNGKFCTECGQVPQAENKEPPKQVTPPKPADVCPGCNAPGQLKSFCTQCGYNKNNVVSPPTVHNKHDKPEWQNDNASSACMKCGDKFSFTNRRHHCRKCGLLVCANCSSNKMQLKWETGLVRVCNQCYN